MLVQITDVQVRDGYKLHLRFDDTAEGEVDISDMISFTGVFAPLADRKFFESVSIDPTWGTVCWPGNIDLAPEPLYERATGRSR